MIAMRSCCVIVAGLRIVSPRMPSSMHVRSFAPTYTALAGSSPTRTTVSPGVTPRDCNAATRAATSDVTRAASCAPSMIVSSLTGKVHRPRLANQHHFDLSRILQLGFDASGNLFGHGRHANVVHVLGQDDDA